MRSCSLIGSTCLFCVLAAACSSNDATTPATSPPTFEDATDETPEGEALPGNTDSASTEPSDDSSDAAPSVGNEDPTGSVTLLTEAEDESTDAPANEGTDAPEDVPPAGDAPLVCDREFTLPCPTRSLS